MSKFAELRRQYHSFIYKDYHIERTPEGLHLRYDFEIPALAEFHPAWFFPVPADRPADLSSPVLRELVFSLGMAESISYWKCACPEQLRVECGELSSGQQRWWRKLYYNGLGEFMYRNGIVCGETELVQFESAGSAENAGCGVPSGRSCAPGAGGGEKDGDAAGADALPLHDPASYAGYLVPVGGGKDSVVSLELLRGEDLMTYCIDGTAGTASIREVTALCAHSRGNYAAKRILDRRLIDLNQQGFLNGHTPFSAIVAFSSVLAAFLTGRKYIALSNETSANETTVPGSFVNHQYSKSFEFEQDFVRYFAGITDSDIHYFSLLRPLTEIQIASLFAGYDRYHMAFRSCNVGSKQGIWCGSCAKCLFVYIILSPFLPEDRLIRIFGEKLLDRPSLDRDFRELSGIDENKPFECVGTRSEVMAALKSYVERGGRSFLTERYRGRILASPDSLAQLLSGWSAENNVPEELQEKIRASLKGAARGEG